MAESKLTLSATAVVSDDAELIGTISIGSSSILHPKCSVLATAAPIVVGERTIVEDRAVLENATTGDDGISSAVAAMVMTIGNGNLFESGCVIRSTYIGHSNWFEPKSETHAGSVIGNNCTIGSGVVIARGEKVPDNTIIVCVQDDQGYARRIVRKQKDYMIKTKQAITQKYIDAFADPNSIYALVKPANKKP